MRGDVPSFVSAMTGNLFVVSAPSGAGKSSLVSAVLAGDKRLALSVSFTTRPPRSGEVDGREYHFVDGKTFEKMLGRGEFLESAEVHGNRYGTSRKWIGESRAKGDRKSTRLNSSHANISYAVFCLKKKKKNIHTNGRRRTHSSK